MSTNGPSNGRPPAMEDSRPVMPYSCVLCYQRKVKCDKRDPCSSCTRSGAACVFRAPAPPRRRKGKTTEGILLARLRKYEEIIRKHGINIENVDSAFAQSDAYTDTPVNTSLPIRPKNGVKEDTDLGLLVGEEGKSKYFDRLVNLSPPGKYMANVNSNLWMTLSDELRSTTEVVDFPSSDDEQIDCQTEGVPFSLNIDDGQLFLGSPNPSTNLHALHPQPLHIFRLWQVFVDNINPLVKICHIPTEQQQVLEAAANLSKITKGTEAFMFAMYTCSVTSLSEDECQSQLGEPKETLLSRFQFGTKQSLINAKFMRSPNLTILRAFALYLVTVRRSLDSQTLWILTGTALRIAQRVGLHRDGSHLGLSIFETEMRRRLWWFMLVLEGYSSELCGAGTSVLQYPWDTHLPLNVNDSDLSPNMKQAPKEHDGPTEMLFYLLRCETGNFMRRKEDPRAASSSWRDMGGSSTTVAEKIKLADNLQALLERKYLRFCDPSIPLHALTLTVGQCMFAVIRLVIYSPLNIKETAEANSEHVDQKTKDILYTNSAKIIQFDSLLRTNEITKHYLWHLDTHFQWHSLIFLLNELRTRTLGPDIDDVWQDLSALFANRPQLLNSKNALYVAIGNLVLKAWNAREQALISSSELASPPEFVQNLRRQRATVPLRPKHGAEHRMFSPASKSAGTTPTTLPNQFTGDDTNNRRPTTSEDAFNSIAPTNFDAHGTEFMEPSLCLPDGAGYDTGMDGSPVNWAQWDTLLQGFNMGEIDEGI
ncbi:hypothetical protein FQN50_004675 [Emmonsiellopsis sp. PD_5]|nr:hypothetical protein FQN50_004675 [Emmonsiellopsis sp. PD_5]